MDSAYRRGGVATERHPESDWMEALATQFAAARRRHPDDELMIVFDIDGTILDMRHMVSRVLIDCDRAHGTDHFVGLGPEDVTVHENHVARFLADFPMPAAERKRVHRWYLERRWSSRAIIAGHRPYRGIMEIIRWFMLQPRTRVGIVTGRPNRIREDTLRSLNALGHEYRVLFEDCLLEMKPNDWEQRVADYKASALRRFRARGYRDFAVVGNEPKNIGAMLKEDEENEVLFLHADTIFVCRAALAPRTVSGKEYTLAGLIAEADIHERVTLVWHGVNDVSNLRQFLTSPVQWGECDVRRDPLDRLVLRHDSFERTPWQRGERCLDVDWLLDEMSRDRKSIKLDLKEGGDTIERVLDRVAHHGYEDTRLWFNGGIETLGKSGFHRLAEPHPGAVLQCPIDFLAPLATAAPEDAQRMLERLRTWGINRFSMGWHNENRQALFERVERWGYDINIYGMPDLESFLRATLMLPRSLTADLNFPAWQYYGRGSGEERRYHEHELRSADIRRHAGAAGKAFA